MTDYFTVIVNATHMKRVAEDANDLFWKCGLRRILVGKTYYALREPTIRVEGA